MTDTVLVFDTTLRDGEQSPGCSMNLEEKLRVAAQLEMLGVDIIEAGFAIASEGDFEAVTEVAKQCKRATVARLHSLATSLTASKSPSEAMAKPASMISTPIVSSWAATFSFSSRFIEQPGDCSPSRRVVSNTRTVSVMEIAPSSGGSPGSDVP